MDRELQKRLSATGAVIIEGPRACGKTATARQAARSEVLLDVDENARRAIAVDPSLVLAGETPRLIDEWQTEPAIWNHVRRAVDDRRAPGQFILTGSAVPADDVTRHTGAARVTRMRMRPMSLYESGHSSGVISLGAMLEGGKLHSPETELSVALLAERIAAGGWPGPRSLPLPQIMQWVRDYLDEIRRVDIGRVDGRRRDTSKVGQMLRSLARHVATPVAATTLASDAGGSESELKDDTVREYLAALERLMIIEDQPAWAPHLRSRSLLRGAPKRHLADPSLAVAALRGTPGRLLRDLELMGVLFESLVVRDLRVYAQAHDATVLHYRDNTGLEVDAIVETAAGSWGAFEIKLGSARVDDGAATLRQFVERVDTSRIGEPAILAVITATGYGYVRDDGVGVIPIGALGP